MPLQQALFQPYDTTLKVPPSVRRSYSQERSLIIDPNEAEDYSDWQQDMIET
jgi:hypothetical protein